MGDEGMKMAIFKGLYPPLKHPVRVDNELLFGKNTVYHISNFAISSSRLAIVASYGKPEINSSRKQSSREQRGTLPKLRHLSPGISQYEL